MEENVCSICGSSLLGVIELRSTQINAILIRSLQTLLLITYQAKLLIHCRSVLEEEDERIVAQIAEHLAFRATAKYRSWRCYISS